MWIHSQPIVLGLMFVVVGCWGGGRGVSMDISLRNRRMAMATIYLFIFGDKR